MNFKEKNRAWPDVTGLLLFQWLHGRQPEFQRQGQISTTWSQNKRKRG